MRCPDCNKFVFIEMAKPELDLQLDDDKVSGEVRLVQICAECGMELAEAELDIEITFDFKHDTEGCDGELKISNEKASNSDRFEGRGHGARHFYGADITATVSCPKCGVKQMVEGSVEEQSSSFDQLN